MSHWFTSKFQKLCYFRQNFICKKFLYDEISQIFFYKSMLFYQFLYSHLYLPLDFGSAYAFLRILFNFFLPIYIKRYAILRRNLVHCVADRQEIIGGNLSWNCQSENSTSRWTNDTFWFYFSIFSKCFINSDVCKSFGSTPLKSKWIVCELAVSCIFILLILFLDIEVSFGFGLNVVVFNLMVPESFLIIVGDFSDELINLLGRWKVFFCLSEKLVCIFDFNGQERFGGFFFIDNLNLADLLLFRLL